MLKFLLLALIPIAFGQFQDPCVTRPCTSPTEVCLRRDTDDRFCIEEKLLQSLLANGLPTKSQQPSTPVQNNMNVQQQQPQQQQLPTQRVGNFVQQAQQLPVARSSILPATAEQRQPVLTLQDKPKQQQQPQQQQQDLSKLRRGNFVSKTQSKVARLQTDGGIPLINTFELDPMVPSAQQPLPQNGRNFGQLRTTVDDVNTISMQPLTPTPVVQPNQQPTFSITDICRGSVNGQQFPYPFDNSKFIICSPPSGSVLSCPQGLRFSTYKNRCEYTDSEPAPACLSNPCQNNGACTNLANYKFRCECEDGFTGPRCESAQTACSGNPCGPRGVCHTFGFATASAQYYCLCDNSRSFSLSTCGDRSAVQNPCLNTMTETFFPVATNADLFVHCYDSTIHLKACAPSLVWSPSILACDYKF
jgi:hypothetical protein